MKKPACQLAKYIIKSVVFVFTYALLIVLLSVLYAKGIVSELIFLLLLSILTLLSLILYFPIKGTFEHTKIYIIAFILSTIFLYIAAFFILQIFVKDNWMWFGVYCMVSIFWAIQFVILLLCDVFYTIWLKKRL